MVLGEGYVLDRAAALNKDLPALVVHRHGCYVLQGSPLHLRKLLLLRYKGWHGDLADLPGRRAFQNALFFPDGAVVSNESFDHWEGDYVAVRRFLVEMTAQLGETPVPLDAVPDSDRGRPAVQELDLHLGASSRRLLLPVEARVGRLLLRFVVKIMTFSRQAAVVLDQPPWSACWDVQKKTSSSLRGTGDLAGGNSRVELVLVMNSHRHFG